MTKQQFSVEEYAQHVADRLERLEGRLKGLHYVLNGVVNELRNADPELAAKISDAVEEQAREGDPSAATIEIVALYVGVLTHGSRPLPNEQQ